MSEYSHLLPGALDPEIESNDSEFSFVHLTEPAREKLTEFIRELGDDCFVESLVVVNASQGKSPVSCIFMSADENSLDAAVKSFKGEK